MSGAYVGEHEKGGYIGVAARTHIKMSRNGIAAVYKGDPVPPGADPDELKRLVDGGFIAKVAEEDLGGLPSENLTTVAEVLAAQGHAAGLDPGDDRPAKSASTDVWRAYAAAHGTEDAETKSRDDLAAEYYPA